MTFQVKVGRPSIQKRILQKIRKYLSRRKRESLNLQMRARLTNHDFSIISENCMGGVLYHDLGMRFLSPTINMFFNAEDFIKLLENPKHYFARPLKIIHSRDYPFPLGQLDDIIIYLNHFLEIIARTKNALISGVKEFGVLTGITCLS